MKELTLYIDKWYIIGAVCTDGVPRLVIPDNKEDRYWLYFYEDTTNNEIVYNPQNEMFSHFGMKRYNFKNETQLFKVIPHTSKIQKNRPASPERNTFEGS